MYRIFATIFLFAISFSALSQELEVRFAGFVGLPYEQVSVEVSNPNESLDAFVVRIAPILDVFTARTEWEACGEIAQTEDGRYALVIGSIQASLSCATSTENIPVGLKAIGQVVNSHPSTPDVRPTNSDQAIQHMHAIRSLPYKTVEKNSGSKGFSLVDFQAGPGYLVVAGYVMHQQGLRTTREVGRLKTVAPRRRSPLRH